MAAALHRTDDRRLAAILVADVAGYSRLMSRDERGTLDRLRALRKSFVEPAVARHGGRVVKLTGDGILAEFASAVGAVEVQIAVAGHEAARAEDDRLRFRIGINLGDVVVDGDDILGDGVNVAARLAALAEPGGLCASGAVHDQVRDKLPYPFEDWGERAVKNIPRPVRVQALRPELLAVLPRAVTPGWSTERGAGEDSVAHRRAALLEALRAAARVGDGRLGPGRVEALADARGVAAEELPALVARWYKAGQVAISWGGTLEVLPEAAADASPAIRGRGAGSDAVDR